MTKIIDQEQWECNICGSSSMDSDEVYRTLEQHLQIQHNLDIKDYARLVDELKIGTSHLTVKLLNYSNDITLPIVSFLSQTWGPTFSLDNYSEKDIQEMVCIALEGQSLSTALECIQFTFQIDGISRASSHQLVRVRIGSGFSQKGMSDAYYGDEDYVIPASIVAVGKEKEYQEVIRKSIDLYKELFEIGVPYQDARFILPHAMTTSLVWSVNFLALRNFCGKRMQRSQSWEMNMLCQLIKRELEKVYPLLAAALVPFCEKSKNCQSFGNLFEGCGKYPLNKKHDRYVFSKEQIAHNIKFTKSYVEYCEKHNKTVKPTNNHFLLLAKERQALEGESDYGKFASEIKNVLFRCTFNQMLHCKETLFEDVFSWFDITYSNFQEYENTRKPFEKNTETLKSFINNVLNLAVLLLHKREEDIKEESWRIHQEKNREYKDGWYYDGIRGIFKDLHRKIARLKTISESEFNDYNSIKNTLCDTLIYGVFLRVAYEQNLPLIGGI